MDRKDRQGDQQAGRLTGNLRGELGKKVWIVCVQPRLARARRLRAVHCCRGNWQHRMYSRPHSPIYVTDPWACSRAMSVDAQH